MPDEIDPRWPPPTPKLPDEVNPSTPKPTQIASPGPSIPESAAAPSSGAPAP
jgi:hypothetical protein